METCRTAAMWRDSKVSDLINIFFDTVQTKLEGSYSNQSVFEMLTFVASKFTAEVGPSDCFRSHK